MNKSMKENLNILNFKILSENSFRSNCATFYLLGGREVSRGSTQTLLNSFLETTDHFRNPSPLGYVFQPSTTFLFHLYTGGGSYDDMWEV